MDSGFSLQTLPGRQRIDIRTFKTDTTNYPDSLKITIGDYVGTRNYPYGWAFDYHFPAGPTNSSHPNITPPVKTDKIIFERNGAGGDRIDISWVRVYYCSSVPPTATPTRTPTSTRTPTPTLTLTPTDDPIGCHSNLTGQNGQIGTRCLEYTPPPQLSQYVMPNSQPDNLTSLVDRLRKPQILLL